MKIIWTIWFFVFSFQVCHAQMTWIEPESISTSMVNASDPRVVIDSSANATAIWIENNQIVSSTQPAGGSWGAVTTLSGTGASEPCLGIDGKGNITAVWVENGIVNAASKPVSGSWGAETPVSSAGASSPQLAVDTAGNAVAVWVRNGFIESSTQLVSGSWGQVNVISAIGNESSPSVSIGANGTVFASWSTSISSSLSSIYTANKPIAGDWNASASIFAVQPSSLNNYPVVAVDLNGNANVVWFSYNVSGPAYVNVVLLASRLTVGSSSWTQPVQLSDTGLYNPADLFVGTSLDSNGNMGVLWTQSNDGDNFKVGSAILSAEGVWTSGYNNLTMSMYSFAADLAVESNGNAVAVVMYYNGTDTVIRSLESNIAGIRKNKWSTPTMISQGNENGYPQVAISSNGASLKAASVWVNYNGVNNAIQAVIGSSTQIAPPTLLSVVQSANNNGVFTEYYNTVTWQPSSDPSVYEYAIYRDGKFVTTVDASILQYIDHNVVQNGMVTYGIATITNSLSQSPTATVNYP